MLLCDASGPDIPAKIFQGFRLADPMKWVTQRCLHQIEQSLGNPLFRYDPVLQILNELGMKDCYTIPRTHRG